MLGFLNGDHNNGGGGGGCSAGNVYDYDNDGENDYSDDKL